MKKEINLIVVLLLVLGIIIAGVAVTIGFTNKKVEYTDLTEVKISVTNPMSVHCDSYTLTLKNGTWFASYSEHFFVEDFENEVAVDEAFANRIIGTLEKYRVHRWDDFNIYNEIVKKVVESIPDGSTYSFYMQFADGSTVKTSAYNASPNGFMTVLKIFEEEFETLFAKDE